MALLAVVADLGAAMAAVKSSQLLCLQEGCEERSLFSCMTLLGMEYSIVQGNDETQIYNAISAPHVLASA